LTSHLYTQRMNCEDLMPENDIHPLPPYIEVTSDRVMCASSRSKRKQSLGETLEVAAFRLLGQRLWYKSCILFSALRSCLGHIRTQLAKDQAGASLASSPESHHPLRNYDKRRLARKQGIRMLQATHPWIDHQDFEIFLMGFHAGEQWAFDSPDLCSTPHPYQS
jgi:hypothetical protein